MTDVVIGVDAGTSTIKAVAFSLDGEELAVSRRSNPVKSPRPGWAEQDMKTTWRRTVAAVEEVLDSTGGEAIGVGVTGQGGGCWLLDGGGEPVRDAILWSDGRAAEYVEEWRTNGVYDIVFDRCGYGPFAGLPLPILRWLADNEPETVERAATLLFCKDWLEYCLTGALTSDPSDASLTHWRPDRGEYDEAVLEAVGLDEWNDVVAPIRTPTSVVGTVTERVAERTGLGPGTPVVSGAMDVVASALGSGAVRPGDGSAVVGTTLQSQVLLAEPSITPPRTGYTLALGIDGMGLRAMGTMAGPPNLDWVLDEVVGSREFAEIEARVRSIPPCCEGLMYHPYLSTAGEKAPFVEPTARAQFTGLSPRHTTDHLLRAVYEGVALAMRDCQAHLPREPDRVYLSGGGTRSDLWCQLFADCLDVEVVVAAGNEFGAKGAALFAGVAIGEYDDVEDAVERTTTIARSYEPDDRTVARYDRWYGLYRDVRESMVEHWRTREGIRADFESSR